jgi:hypothetical protein
VISMLLWSFELIPLLFATYIGWLALLVTVVALLLTRSVAVRPQSAPLHRIAPRWILFSLAIVPLLTLIAGTVLWKKWQDPTFIPLLPQQVSTYLVSGLAILQLPVSAGVVWCRRPVSLTETALVLFSLVWAWSCCAVSTMAVTGNWL